MYDLRRGLQPRDGRSTVWSVFDAVSILEVSRYGKLGERGASRSWSF